jgi:hypothetical protein
MNARSKQLLLVGSALALALSSSGCRLLKKKEDAAPTATAPVAVTTPAPAPAPVPAPAAPAAEPTVNVADDAIATTEDFEDEAFAKVSDKTYKTDLESLKKEIEEP